MPQPMSVMAGLATRRMSSPVHLDKIKEVPKIQLNGTETDYSHPLFSSAEFMMFYYKVMPCMKSYRHDWRVCPYAHVGETAARRHPKLHSYVGVICPEAKKGEKCPRGDSCPCTHSLFEYWLHPTRFKTEFCSRGSSCSRSFCFFAHSESEIRVFDSSVLSSPMARKALSIAEGNDFKRRHTSRPSCGDTPLINRPFGAMDVGLAGQNIWSVRPFDHLSKTSNMCGMSTISSDVGATPTPPLLTAEAISAAPLSSLASLWNHGNPLSNFESGQGRSPTSDLGSHQRSKISWPDLNRQALNDYLSFEALTALYMLLPPSDK